MVAVMGSLVLLLEETSFEVVKTDLIRVICCNNSFCIGWSIFSLLETMMLSVGKATMFPQAET